jgi:hypothetical protein
MGIVILKYSSYQNKIMFKHFQFEVFNNDWKRINICNKWTRSFRKLL